MPTAKTIQIEATLTGRERLLYKHFLEDLALATRWAGGSRGTTARRRRYPRGVRDGGQPPTCRSPSLNFTHSVKARRRWT